MSAILLSKLRDMGLAVTVNGTQLIVRPSHIITAEIRKMIKEYKWGLIVLLREEAVKIVKLSKLIKQVSNLYGGGDTEAELDQYLSDTLKVHNIDDALACFRRVIMEKTNGEIWQVDLALCIESIDAR